MIILINGVLLFQRYFIVKVDSIDEKEELQNDDGILNEFDPFIIEE